MAAVGFSLSDAKRIAAATRRIEGTPQDLRGTPNPAGPAGTQFWAYLLSTDLSGNHWTFLKLVPAARLPNADEPFAPLESDRPLWELAQPVFYGEGAREANGNKAIEGGTAVQVTFIGYDTSEERKPVYVFTYGVAQPDPGFVPIHDHRDNITGGGFAFAVYAPGTALPQQPWYV